MRKINFFEYILTLIASSACGIFFSGTLIYYTSTPVISKIEQPVVAYEKINVNLHKATISGSSPFTATLPSVSNIDIPEPPDIPNMPKIVDTSQKLKVLGVLPPDICIIQRGSDTITSRRGESTKLGNIGDITNQGVYIDGQYIQIGN